MSRPIAPIVVALCMVLASCVSSGMPSPVRPPAEEKYPATSKTTAVGDILAGGRLRVVDSQMLGDRKNLLGCNVTIENISGKHIKGRCLVRWFEKDGHEAVLSARRWQQLDLAPAAKVEVTSLAPVPWCTGFAIDVIVDK